MSIMKIVALAAFVFTVLMPTARADIAELNNCNTIPQEVKFVRELTQLGYLTRRYEKYPGQDWVILPKNPEMVYEHGPVHARNCTPGSSLTGTQVLTFKMKTTNWFGPMYTMPQSSAGGHIAILLRGHLNRTNYSTTGDQTGRGLAVFSSFFGGLGNVEYFSEGNRLEPMNISGNGFIQRWEDGTWFNHVIHVTQIGIAYWVMNLTTHDEIYGYHQGTVATPDAGYGFGALCTDTICEGSTPPFEIHIKDITISWFQP